MKDYDTKQVKEAFLPHKYKKHHVMFYIDESGKPFNMSVNSYWDGGSKSYYVMLAVADGREVPLTTDPTTSFPKFTDRKVEVPVGFCICESGTFCGKTATAKIYCHRADLEKILK